MLNYETYMVLNIFNSVLVLIFLIKSVNTLLILEPTKQWTKKRKILLFLISWLVLAGILLGVSVPGLKRESK